MRINKEFLSVVIGLVLLSVVLGACAPASTPTVEAPANPKPTEAPTANFPTGKFIKEGETDYGLAFNPDGTFYVF